MDAGLLWTAVGSVVGVVDSALVVWQIRLPKSVRSPGWVSLLNAAHPSRCRLAGRVALTLREQ